MNSYEAQQSFLERVNSVNDAGTITPKHTWLRYHGCSMYAASAMLATNHPCLSEETGEGMETSCGRGVYTSRDFRKALSYSTPHRLPGSSLLTEIVLFLVIPGEEGEGGVAEWTKGNTEWFEVGGVWTKRPKFQLTEPGMQLSRTVAIVCPELHARITNKRDISKGEIPWTNMDEHDSEEQSSVAHVAGFFVTHTSATVCRRSTCLSRAKECFDDWNWDLEVPCGKPQVWDDVRLFNPGGQAPPKHRMPPTSLASSSSSLGRTSKVPPPPSPPNRSPRWPIVEVVQAWIIVLARGSARLVQPRIVGNGQSTTVLSVPSVLSSRLCWCVHVGICVFACGWYAGSVAYYSVVMCVYCLCSSSCQHADPLCPHLKL